MQPLLPVQFLDHRPPLVSVSEIKGMIIPNMRNHEVVIDAAMTQDGKGNYIFMHTKAVRSAVLRKGKRT